MINDPQPIQDLPQTAPQVPVTTPPPPLPVAPAAAPVPPVLPVAPVVPVTPVVPVAPVVPPIVPPVAPVIPVTPIPPILPPTPLTVPTAPPIAPTTPVATPTEVYEGKGSGKYKVVVIKDKCIGAASCVAIASKAFKLNDSQIVQVLPTISAETDETLLLSAQSCPTAAIEVYDTVTGEKVWPK